MMFLLGNIGAPPTVTGFCAKAVLDSIVTSANKLNANNFFMRFSLSRNPEFLNSCLQEPRSLAFTKCTDALSGLDCFIARHCSAFGFNNSWFLQVCPNGVDECREIHTTGE